MVADRLGDKLLWKFVAVEDAVGNIAWRWEAWTQSGQLVASSPQSYAMLTECERAAAEAGFAQPGKPES